MSKFSLHKRHETTGLRAPGTMTYDNDHDHFYKMVKTSLYHKIVMVIVNGHSQKSLEVKRYCSLILNSYLFVKH